MTTYETVAYYIEAIDRLKTKNTALKQRVEGLELDLAALEAEHEALDAAFGELQRQVEGLEIEIYRQMQGKRLLGERHAATGYLLRDFNDNYKKIKDKYANLQKTLDNMDDGELLKDYRNWKAINANTREAG